MTDRQFSILIADESDGLRESFRDALEPEGYDVIPAATGREAIDIVRREPVHIVVMDIRLPDYAGLEIYHAIKEIRDAYLPCIFTALKLTTHSLQDALSEDAITILPKPVDVPRLVHAVAWSVGKYYSHGMRRAPRLRRDRDRLDGRASRRFF